MSHVLQWTQLVDVSLISGARLGVRKHLLLGVDLESDA